MPRSRMRRANSRTIGNGFKNTSSPKLSEPALSVAISGSHRSGCARSSALIPTAPPVVVWTITSQRARMARIAFSNSARSCVGLPSSLRTCRWMTDAPACAQRSASVANSSEVMGRYGVCSRVVSAPQIAAVRTAGGTGMRRILPRRPQVRSVGERGAFLHFLDRATHLALLVPLGQVAQADHPEGLAVLVAGEDAGDLALLHQLGRLLDLLVRPDADDVPGHRLLDLGVLHVAALGDEAHHDVAVGDGADRLARRVDHGQEADVLLGYLAGDLLDAGIGPDRDDVPLEQFLNAHTVSLDWVRRQDAHPSAPASAARVPLLARRGDARTHGPADHHRLREQLRRGVRDVGTRRDHLARLEAHLPAGLPDRDDLAFHLDEVARVQRREE